MFFGGPVYRKAKMLFKDLNPGDKFNVVAPPKVDRYNGRTIFERLGPDGGVRWSHANAVDLSNDKEYTFRAELEVKRCPS